MKLLVPFFLTSAILALCYGKTNDPNDEPFLPIYPVYPYSPKLIKRGTDREAVTQLTPELYAPKVDAKDSYTASFSTNYPRDHYYSNYGPYPKASTPSSYSYYDTLPYSYPTTPYAHYNSYSSPYTVPAPPYSAIPYSSSYPNYYYQPPYYYPNYYNQPLFPPPPLPPPGVDYSNDPYFDAEPSEKGKNKKLGGEKRYKDSDVNQDSAGSQFIDGGNYISGSTKDLDGQSSTYKLSSSQNQLEQLNAAQVKNLPIPLPKTTYRVISVAGQPVGPDYPLPPTYLKAQQLEDLMSHTWAKVFVQNLQQQAAQYNAQEAGKMTAARTIDGPYVHKHDQNKDTQRYISVPNAIAKGGLAYIVNPTVLGKMNSAQSGQLPTTQLKSIKYPLSPGIYTAVEKPEKDQGESDDFDKYESTSVQDDQDFESSLSQTDKQPENYANDPGQSVSYQNQNFVTVETPRGYTYQYSGYNPPQTSAQQQSQAYKNNLDEVNFGTKTKKS